MPTPASRSLFRQNSLDEMTVGRTEKPVPGRLPQKPKIEPDRGPISPLEGEMSPKATEGGVSRPAADDPRPIIRAKPGVGSYEDPGDQKRKTRTKGKTGRPGR
jgi:excinuclease ABC subunit B